jgi:hypothetical protein
MDEKLIAEVIVRILLDSKTMMTFAKSGYYPFLAVEVFSGSGTGW